MKLDIFDETAKKSLKENIKMLRYTRNLLIFSQQFKNDSTRIFEKEKKHKGIRAEILRNLEQTKYKLEITINHFKYKQNEEYNDKL